MAGGAAILIKINCFSKSGSGGKSKFSVVTTLYRKRVKNGDFRKKF